MDQFPFQPLGKLLVITGLFIIFLGLILIFAHKIPLIGRLPGDIVIQRKNFTFYFSLTTIILLNLLILLVSFLLRK